MFKLRVSKGLAVDSIHATMDPEAGSWMSAGGVRDMLGSRTLGL